MYFENAGYSYNLIISDFFLWSSDTLFIAGGLSILGNADKITANETFGFTYTGTSASFSWPPGLSVTPGTNSIVVNFPELTNSKTYGHYYSNLVGKAWAIYGINQASQATFSYGNRTFTVGAYDSKNI
ncbi:hypothetical protein [Paenibacillus sp. J22TS3]|uniref:hypothetical protein n=1 Tax=Paenibacillus sp. J22TS3 TaxID=2807192 RepID=UPI001B230FD1|nr:hypothetical protein [Paenibacillus sp. J22TS3]GIP22585.1 hypothetical protein J22TS3_28600 [Paenibacillus sp. J22TS3]